MTQARETASATPRVGSSVPLRVAIVYQVLHHFREPLFRALSADPEIEYTFVAAAENTLDTNATIDPAKATLPVSEGGLRWRFVRNRRLPADMLWQHGVCGIALSRDFDAIIFLANPYYLSTWVAALLSRATGKRTLMWGHGLVRPERGPKWWLRKLLYRIGQGNLVYSHRAEQLLVERGFDSDRIHVVYNSLDYERQARIREAIRPETLAATRAKLFGDPDATVVCCIGRLDERKQIDRLIESAARLEARGRPLDVLLIGDGADRERLAARARDLGIEQRVHFYGPSYDEEEIGLLLSLSTLCVCPGHTGLTAVHAMAYGVPVITHDDLAGHAPEVEIIVPGENGDLYRAGDTEALTETIEAWLESDRDAEAVRRSCIAAIEGRFTPRDQARLIRRVLLDQA